MARKRPSLKDKKIFEKSKELQTLFGDSLEEDTKDKTETTETVAETSPETSSETSAETEALTEAVNDSVDDPADFSALAVEAESAAEMSPDDDVAALLSAEAEAALTPPETDSPAVDDFADFSVAEAISDSAIAESLPSGEAGEPESNVDDFFDFPVAAETPPDSLLTESLPSEEAGEPESNVDDFFDFPVAAETPPDSPLTESLPSEEAGEPESNVDDFFDFPVAAETPPDSLLTESLPSEEAGEPESNVDDFFDFPVAAEAPPDIAIAEDLPSGEAGDTLTDVDDTLDFPVASESQDSLFAPAMPSGEAGDVAESVDDTLDFPTAVADEASLATPTMPAGEAGDIEDALNDFADFPPAAEIAPELSDAVMPAGEAGDIAASLDDFRDFPPAAETPSDEALAVDPTFQPASAGENGDFNNELASATMPAQPFEDEFDFDLADSALAEDPPPLDIPQPVTEMETTSALDDTASTLPVTPRPVVPPPSTPVPGYSPPETIPVAESYQPARPYSGPAVSRTTRISIGGDDIPDDILGFRTVPDETNQFAFELDDTAERLSEEERQSRAKLLNDPRVREQFLQTYNAIDAEYEHILSSNISVSKDITDWAHKLLGETRYIVLNYQIEYLAKAEWNIEQVRARLDRAEESEKQADRWTTPIVIWAMVWFFVFVYFLFNPDFLLDILKSAQATSDLLVADIFLRSLFFGGIGGVTAVFYNLLQYVTRRQFDPEYNVSYFAKPFMGMTLATLVYLLVFVTMRVLGLLPENVGEPVDASSEVFYFAAITWTLSLAAGFKENVAFELLDKVMKILLRRDSDSKDEVTAPPPPPGPYDSTSST